MRMIALVKQAHHSARLPRDRLLEHLPSPSIPRGFEPDRRRLRSGERRNLSVVAESRRLPAILFLPLGRKHYAMPLAFAGHVELLPMSGKGPNSVSRVLSR
jgi:hypothetical protein